MAHTRKTYPPEFKRRMVELVRTGRSPEELAREFDPSANTIRNWAAQADVDEGLRADGLTTEERSELRQLRRKVKPKFNSCGGWGARKPLWHNNPGVCEPQHVVPISTFHDVDRIV